MPTGLLLLIGRAACPDGVRRTGDIAAGDGSKIAAVEAIGLSRQHKHVPGIQADAAAPSWHGTLQPVRSQCNGDNPAIDGDSHAVAANDVARAGGDPLD